MMKVNDQNLPPTKLQSKITGKNRLIGDPEFGVPPSGGLFAEIKTRPKAALRTVAQSSEARVIAPSDADETSAAYLWKTPDL